MSKKKKKRIINARRRVKLGKLRNVCQLFPWGKCRERDRMFDYSLLLLRVKNNEKAGVVVKGSELSFQYFIDSKTKNHFSS